MATRHLTPIECEQIRHEHDEICELATVLFRILVERHATPDRVGRLLQSLKERVGAHFQDEEENGLFADLSRQAPNREAEVAHLRQEHERLLTQLTDLHRAAETAEFTTACWDHLEKGFHVFNTELCHHEARENELLQRIYDEDVGCND